MTKILITGGAGYIGSNVTNLLIDNGFEVTVIDNLITGNKNLINKKATFVNCDIADQKIINTLLLKDKYEVVIHFAGLIRVDESVNEPEKSAEGFAPVGLPPEFCSTVVSPPAESNSNTTLVPSVLGNINEPVISGLCIFIVYFSFSNLF